MPELQGRFVTHPVTVAVQGHPGLAWQVQQAEPWHTYGFLASGITASLSLGLPGLGLKQGGAGLPPVRAALSFLLPCLPCNILPSLSSILPATVMCQALGICAEKNI